VILLHRHGDRAPLDQLNVPDDVFREQWPYGPGELTPLGMKQLFNLGEQLRERYVGKVTQKERNKRKKKSKPP
jgi:hypothetical protein